jgi:hypothetical protein
MKPIHLPFAVVDRVRGKSGKLDVTIKEEFGTVVFVIDSLVDANAIINNISHHSSHDIPEQLIVDMTCNKNVCCEDITYQR